MSRTLLSASAFSTPNWAPLLGRIPPMLRSCVGYEIRILLGLCSWVGFEPFKEILSPWVCLHKLVKPLRSALRPYSMLVPFHSDVLGVDIWYFHRQLAQFQIGIVSHDCSSTFRRQIPIS